MKHNPAKAKELSDIWEAICERIDCEYSDLDAGTRYLLKRIEYKAITNR